MIEQRYRERLLPNYLASNQGFRFSKLAGVFCAAVVSVGVVFRLCDGVAAVKLKMRAKQFQRRQKFVLLFY